MTRFAVWVVHNNRQTDRQTEFHRSPRRWGQLAVIPFPLHPKPNTSLSQHNCVVWHWSARCCPSTFNPFFNCDAGWNVQQSLQRQENQAFEARGQRSATTLASRWSLSSDLNLWPACPHINSGARPQFYDRRSPRRERQKDKHHTALASLRPQGSSCFSSPLMQCVLPWFLILLHHPLHVISGFTGKTKLNLKKTPKPLSKILFLIFNQTLYYNCIRSRDNLKPLCIS